MTYFCPPIAHHGIQGQKWGVRRYTNPDGTLTEAGKKRYYVNGDEHGSLTRKGLNESVDLLNNVGLTDRQLNEAREYGNKQLKLFNKAADIKEKIMIGSGIVGGLAASGFMAYSMYNSSGTPVRSAALGALIGAGMAAAETAMLVNTYRKSNGKAYDKLNQTLVNDSFMKNNAVARVGIVSENGK